jgi:hypothetical protein
VRESIKHKRLFHKKFVRKFRCALCKKVSIGKKASILHERICSLKKQAKEKFQRVKKFALQPRSIESDVNDEAPNTALNDENYLGEWETKELMYGNAFSHTLHVRSNFDLQIT